MNSNPLKHGSFAHGSFGPDPVTRGTVRRRAVELAMMDGRTSLETSKADWDGAMAELTGIAPADPSMISFEALPEAATRDPVPASTGQQVPVAAGEDEDDEGRTDQTLLVEEGLAGAERDRRLQAAGSGETGIAAPARGE